MSITTDIEVVGLGPHPIMDTLISWEPEDSHVREVFGLGHRALPALEPDAVYDPQPDRVITHARVISATPTGSLMLDMGPGRSFAIDVMRGRAAEYTA